jgi:hypothetical protein
LVCRGAVEERGEIDEAAEGDKDHGSWKRAQKLRAQFKKKLFSSLKNNLNYL